MMEETSGVPKPPPGTNAKVDLLDDKYVYIAEDGVRFEWDAEKHAWFPMWDERLMESQQAAYNNHSMKVADNEVTKEEPVAPTKKRLEKSSNDSGPRKNPNIYVTGLPTDVKIDEVHSYFSKCGIIKEDIETGQPRIKLYKSDQGTIKGDALITYNREESVSLAVNLFDQTEFRPGFMMHVQQAVFENKDQSTTDTKKINKRPMDKRKLQAKARQLEKQLGWFDEDALGKRGDRFKRAVVLKNMFTQQELEQSPTLIFDLKEDISEECGKIGDVSSVSLIDTSEEGVVIVKFANEIQAEKCVALMNGRLFSGRTVVAHLHDGKKYGRQETEQEREERVKRYGIWLEQQNKTHKEESTSLDKPTNEGDNDSLSAGYCATPPRIENDAQFDDFNEENSTETDPRAYDNVESLDHGDFTKIDATDVAPPGVTGEFYAPQVDLERAREFEIALLEEEDEDDCGVENETDQGADSTKDKHKRHNDDLHNVEEEAASERLLNELMIKRKRHLNYNNNEKDDEDNDDNE